MTRRSLFKNLIGAAIVPFLPKMTSTPPLENACKAISIEREIGMHDILRNIETGHEYYVTQVYPERIIATNITNSETKGYLSCRRAYLKERNCPFKRVSTAVGEFDKL